MKFSKRITVYLALALMLYAFALFGLSFNRRPLWPALLLGVSVALLSGIAFVITRGKDDEHLDIIHPRAEAGIMLFWYGLVLLLAILTSARGLELVNQFTNWFFLVIVPTALLILTRGRGLRLRATLRSVGLRRKQLTTALKLALLMGLLLPPVLYLIGEQQRAAIQMVIQEPLRATTAFGISFALALLTAGFVEEFFFRGLLQSRISACLGSEGNALILASILFGLFHLPVYLFSPFEPTQGNPVWALASVMTEQAVVGVLLGMLWMQTHNLAAPVLVHAFMDALAMMSAIKIGSGI